MEQLVEDLTRGNVTEVKVVLATVVLGLASYQVLLMAVGYGKLRLPFLSPRVAAWTHRAAGDAIVVLTVIVAAMCLSYYGFEDEGRSHAVMACALIGLLAVKVIVVRTGRLDRLLPVLGISVLVGFVATWLSSAGGFLGVA